MTVFLTSISFLGRYLLQHEEEGGLVDREDAPEGLHRLRHARRHGPEGKVVQSIVIIERRLGVREGGNRK